MILRKSITIALCIIMVLPISAFADETVNLTIKDAVDLSVENNNSLHMMKLGERKMLDGVRSAIDGGKTANYVMNQYYDYIQMYEIGGSHIDKYKKMSSDEIMTAYKAANMAIIMNPMMPAASLQKLQDEMKFAEYIMMFGSGEPKLADSEKYNKYLKNIELAKLSAQSTKDKYYLNMDSIEHGVEGGITNLYLQVLDMEQNVLMQKSLLVYYDKNFKNIEAKYNKGLISELEYKKGKDTYDIQKKNYDKLLLNYENLKYTFNSQLGLSMDQKVNLTTNLSYKEKYNSINKNDYIERALKSSSEYQIALMDLNNKQSEKDLYEKYVDAVSRDKQQIESDLRVYQAAEANVKDKITSNVLYALEDMVSAKASYEKTLLDLQISKDKFLQGKKQFELGLIDESIVLALESSYLGSVVSKNLSERKLFNIETKFELLIDSGVSYN